MMSTLPAVGIHADHEEESEMVRAKRAKTWGTYMHALILMYHMYLTKFELHVYMQSSHWSIYFTVSIINVDNKHP